MARLKRIAVLSHPHLLRVSVWCLGLWMLQACGSEEDTGRRSFCYWETEMTLDERDYKLMGELRVTHFYFHYFDLDWSERHQDVVPFAELDFMWSAEHVPLHLTPSVFITNRSFEKLPKSLIPYLARRTAHVIEEITETIRDVWVRRETEKKLEEKFGKEREISYEETNTWEAHWRDELNAKFNKRIQQVLIDCDWTEKTRADYFLFLRELKKVLGDKKLQVTIRLWQYKSPDVSGVPPADEGLLMCYGLASPNGQGTGNAIGTADAIKPYLQGAEPYPLPLDVALPIYSWSVLTRAGEFQGMLHDVQLRDLHNDVSTWTLVSQNEFMLRKDTVIGKYYARMGDKVKIHQLNPQELQAVADLVQEYAVLQAGRRLTFFSWQYRHLNRYGETFLNSVYEKMLQ